ncbi:histidine kinase [Galactobacter sp.]|uniref:sensor histidine kinase n=1 Tax=Galactobacter sp. TaxID=2676125 RepID=UPI0025BC0844|nr:histidine kinase [Galactobacter sp.]
MSFTSALLPALVGPDAPADWERPGPTRTQQIHDVIIAVLVFGVGLLAWWVYDDLDNSTIALWQAATGLGVQSALLSIRRRFPLICLIAATVAFIAISQWLPGLSVQLSFQGAYFTALYSAAAWSKDTRAFRACTAGILVVMGVWLVIGSTLFGAYQKIVDAADGSNGALPPFVAWMLYSVLMNVAYFAGALYFGRRARAGAWQHDRLMAQHQQLKEQSAELARRAVVDERLRIARELHDVVAHHISAVGIQAAAARRVQPKAPDTAAELLTQVESSARSALSETRALLGVLRSDPGQMPADASSAPADTTPEPAPPAASAGSRAPEPGLEQGGERVEEMAPDLRVELSRVQTDGLALAQVPAHLGLTLYRVVQEALTNVRRHSTARSATVALRTGHDEALGDWVEAEILDTGRALPTPRGPAGSGYGLEGIRERAALHVGVAEIGPRTGSAGFRVRLRVPLTRPDTTDQPENATTLPDPEETA